MLMNLFWGVLFKFYPARHTYIEYSHSVKAED